VGFHSITNRFWIRVVTFQKTLFRQRPPNSHQRRLHGQVDPSGVPADLTGIAGQPSGLIPFEVLTGAAAGLPKGQNRDYSQRSGARQAF
jgi:hypothetical protein